MKRRRERKYKTEEIEAFYKYCIALDECDLFTNFLRKGRVYKIVGYNIEAIKYPIVADLFGARFTHWEYDRGCNKQYVLSELEVRDCLRKTPNYIKYILSASRRWANDPLDKLRIDSSLSWLEGWNKVATPTKKACPSLEDLIAANLDN